MGGVVLSLESMYLANMKRWLLVLPLHIFAADWCASPESCLQRENFGPTNRRWVLDCWQSELIDAKQCTTSHSQPNEEHHAEESVTLCTY